MSWRRRILVRLRLARNPAPQPLIAFPRVSIDTSAVQRNLDKAFRSHQQKLELIAERTRYI